MSAPHRHHVRAGYGDTDQSGVVHHAVYLRWLEDARVGMWRERGMDFRTLERDHRVGMAVHDLRLRYLRPARFDDALEVEVWVSALRRASIELRYRVWRGEELLAEAQVTLACVDLDRMRAARLPAQVRACC